MSPLIVFLKPADKTPWDSESQPMISIRKHIEDYRAQKSEAAKSEAAKSEAAKSEAAKSEAAKSEAVPKGEPSPVRIVEPARDPGISDQIAAEFRGMLLAIGAATGRAVPNLGVDIGQKMTGIEKSLVAPVTPGGLAKTNQQARTELSQWADRALARYQDIQRELREVLAVVSTAAEAVCKRDEKYTNEIGVLTGRLGAIAEDNDLTNLRSSLVDCTKSLKSCVARMNEESKASVQQLTSQVKEYQVRLEEAEKESLTDALTSLSNRRAFERHLESWVASRKPFSLIMIDLDDFKGVNDTFGHVAGDDLLRQFASELRSQFTSAEMVSRLGGDEFIVVMPGEIVEANDKADRIRKWTLGEYKINNGTQTVKTELKASIGVAEWDGHEGGIALLARVDQEVYKAKRSGSRARKTNPEAERRAAPSAAPKKTDFGHVIR